MDYFIICKCLITKNKYILTLWISYGFPFLKHTYLYHIGRKDHRHNFAPHFYSTYLTYTSTTVKTFANPLLSLVPQLTLSLGLGIIYGCNNLPLAWFLQTFAFVTFNRVCTSQYFLWYLWLLPTVLPTLNLKLHQKIWMPSLWVVSQVSVINNFNIIYHLLFIPYFQ